YAAHRQFGDAAAPGFCRPGRGDRGLRSAVSPPGADGDLPHPVLSRPGDGRGARGARLYRRSGNLRHKGRDRRGRGGGRRGRRRTRARPSPGWLARMGRLQNYSPGQLDAYGRVVGALTVPAAFAALSVEGEIAAMAFGAVHRGHVSYESVIVDPR